MTGVFSDSPVVQLEFLQNASPMSVHHVGL